MSTSAQAKATIRRDVQNLLKDARIGYPTAQYEAGLRYASGNGVGKNHKQALHWFQAAADKGHAAAQYLLGSAHAQGIGTARNDLLAFEWFYRAANQGEDKAQLRLGQLFSEAQPALARHYLQSAAEAGHPAAQFSLAEAWMHDDKDGEHQEQARNWYRKAADQGHAGALHALARQVPADDASIQQKIGLLRKASESGSPAAQYELEQLALQGHAVLSWPAEADAGRDPAPETVWAAYAAQGSADDQYHLGLLHESGKSLPRSLKLARQNYKAAAQRGHRLAQMALARLCEESDRAQALRWYQAAAEQGDADAHLALARMHGKGDGADVYHPLRRLSHLTQAAVLGQGQALAELESALQHPENSLLLFCNEQAARCGNAAAQRELGKRYLLGEGMARDERQALYWFEQAASQGDAEALYRMAVLQLRGPLELQNHRSALVALADAAQREHPGAQWELGSLLASGSGGLQRDVRKATALCKKSALTGFAPAQATLGILFAQAKKYEQAASWWEKAAAQNDPEALFNLANACKNGRGTAKDLHKARALMQRAATAGLAAAQVQIGLTYATGDNVPADTVEACKWFFIAAAQGDAAGMANIGHAKTLLNQAQLREAERRAQEWRAHHE